jgi:Ca2+-binding EF-hand superfamily protein
VGLKLFEPCVNDGGNLYLNNVKRAFKSAGVELDASTANLIVQRYDSNNDSEMTHSDILEIFKPLSLAMQKELERRTLFERENVPLSKHMLDYIKDVFE